MRRPPDRRRFVQQVSMACAGLAWPARLARAGADEAPAVVLLRPTGPGAFATDAADGFALGLDEVERAASLLGTPFSGVELEPSTTGIARLRALQKAGAPLALVTTASGARARQAAAIVTGEGGLAFCGHERLVDDAWTWMPPDDAVVDLAAGWAADEGLRAWHVVTTEDAGDRALRALVQGAATEGGARIVGQSVARGRDRALTGTAVHPDADVVVIASRSPSFGVDATSIPGGADVPVVWCAVAAAPDGGDARRRLVPEIWHGSLRRYGATQLNSRFRIRFGRPMTSTAWGHWLAVKAAWEVRARFPDAGRAGHAMTRGDALTRLALDGQKGVGLRFEAGRPLAQTLYLVERRTDAQGQDRSVVVATRERPRGGAGAADGAGLRHGRPVGGPAHLRE